MSEKMPKTGEICWTELMTPDTKKAKQFYNAMFGWETDDHDMGHTVYSIFKQNGKNLNGGMLPTPKGQEKNIPPHWISYIYVENLDEMVKKAQNLGASVKVPVTAAGDMGRFAIIADPTGAAIGLWQSNNSGKC